MAGLTCWMVCPPLWYEVDYLNTYWVDDHKPFYKNVLIQEDDSEWLVNPCFFILRHGEASF